MDDQMASRIEVKALTLSYGSDVVLDALSPLPSIPVPEIEAPVGEEVIPTNRAGAR